MSGRSRAGARVADARERPAASAPDDGLTDRQHAILAFERRWWRHAGAKDAAIRDQFGLTSTRYYQLLGALIDTPEALIHDPILVRRLQRDRDARVQSRAVRALYTNR